MGLDTLLQPDDLNHPVSRAWLWVTLPMLAIGAGGALLALAGTFSEWTTIPHPAVQAGLIIAALLATATIAHRIITARPVVAPVRRPPRPWLVRALGACMAIVFGVLVLITPSWLERFVFCAGAIGGLGWFLFPAKHLPAPHRVNDV